MTRQCPALLVCAPASGQGKTTLVAALARHHCKLGRRVRVFKVGPDFLDPMVLTRASGNPVYQLDLFMGGETHCRQLLYEAAFDADLILIEGVMGLFDGEPSTADLAVRFNLPVLAVIDAAAMAQTFGAVAHGLHNYREDVHLVGVIANCCAGLGHQEMLRKSLPAGIQWYGGLLRDAAYLIPERHLGLIQSEELADLDTRLDQAAAALGHAADRLPEAIDFLPPPLETSPSPWLTTLVGQRIAVAYDAAFSFIYPANLDLLRACGAELHFFSPLANDTLPDCEALWLPGGYPELHLARLAENIAVHASIRRHHDGGKPILAECGGMLYLAETLSDIEGRIAHLVGIVPAQARMQTRLAALGLQTVTLPEGELRGHTFHHSQMSCDLTPLTCASNPNGGSGEAVYRLGRLTASYLHFYFPSNPQAAAALFCT